MKTWKRFAAAILAMCMAVTVMLIPDAPVFAAVSVPSSVAITTKSQTTDAIQVSYGKGDVRLANVKSNNKNLIVKQTTQYWHKDEYTWATENKYGYAYLGLYAKKAGTYKVSFDVYSKTKKLASKTVTVKAADAGTSVSPFKSVTFNGKSNVFYKLTGSKSGKFKVTMNKGYKVKSITMKTYNKKGESVSKTIKNNQKVTLGQYADVYTYDYDYGTSWSYYYRTDMFATTYFEVTYQNTKTKAISTSTWYLYTTAKNN